MRRGLDAGADFTGGVCAIVFWNARAIHPGSHCHTHTNRRARAQLFTWSVWCITSRHDITTSNAPSMSLCHRLGHLIMTLYLCCAFRWLLLLLLLLNFEYISWEGLCAHKYKYVVCVRVFVIQPYLCRSVVFVHSAVTFLGRINMIHKKAIKGCLCE